LTGEGALFKEGPKFLKIRIGNPIRIGRMCRKARHFLGLSTLNWLDVVIPARELFNSYRDWSTGLGPFTHFRVWTKKAQKGVTQRRRFTGTKDPVFFPMFCHFTINSFGAT